MNKLLWTLCLCFFVLTIEAQSSRIQAKIDALLKDPALKHASVGIAVVDTESGKTIAQYNQDKSLLPASTLKVITTASAIGILGADYTFKTKLGYTGQIKESKLQGDVIIKGFGDPTLGSDRMEEANDWQQIMTTFIEQLQHQGIECIEGTIIGDASYFGSDSYGDGWQWSDLDNYYAAGVWALNFHENLYYLDFAQSRQLGSTPRISQVRPTIEALAFINELKSAGANTGDNAYIYGSPYANTQVIRGSIPIGSSTFTIKGAVPNAPLWIAQQLHTQLNHNDISVNQVAATNMSWDSPLDKTEWIYTHRSPKLSTIVERTNIKSVNLYCEAMLRTIGQRQKEIGSAEAGIKAIQAFWEDRGLAFDGVKLDDGSGLSKNNVVTAKFMAQLLRKIQKDDKIYPYIRASLPIAGKTGGMKYMLRNTSGVGKVRAKTGSLDNVRAFAGYVDTSSKKTLSFSIMVNNYSCSGAQLRKKLAPLLLEMTKY